MAGLLSDEELIDKLYGPNADTVDADVYRRFGLTPNLKRGTVLPVARDEQGNLTPAVPQSVIDFLKAVSLPGHVMRGGQYTPSDVTEMVLNTGLLGSVATKPAGALASGLARNAAELPMDEASRMARANEMEFSTNANDRLYHLTKADFDSFKLMGDPKSHTGGGAIWLRRNPQQNIAHHQVGGRGGWEEGANDMPVYAKMTNPISPQEVWELQKAGKLSLSFPRRVSPEENTILQNMGFTHAETPSGDEVAVFNPRNIRSRFAAFDPAKKDSADLLAGVAGLPGVASFLDGVNKDSRKRGISKVTK